MTPSKIKAKELVDKFRNEYKWLESDYPVDLYRGAKQCALIAVEEILPIAKYLDGFSMESLYKDEPDYQSWESYWQQVKSEIQSLIE